MQALDRLFLHFFDVHYLEATANRVNRGQLVEEMRLATRIALIAARQVLIPASSYFESPLGREVIDELAPLFNTGAVRLVGGAASVTEFIESKLLAYDETGPQFDAYVSVRDDGGDLPPFAPRVRSATKDITRTWLDLAGSPGFETTVLGRSREHLNAEFVERWENIPAELGGRAFTPEYVRPLLIPKGASPLLGMRVGNVINAAYFTSFSVEFAAGFVTNLSVMSAPHGVDNRFGNVDYIAVREQLRASGKLVQVLDTPAVGLIDLRDDTDVVMAILTGVSAIDPTLAVTTNLRLDIPVDLEPAVRKMRAIRPGKRSATTYHHTVADILDDVFSGSLQRAKLEERLNEGRKRVDISYRNVATTGVFQWLHTRFSAPHIFVECKNYSQDLANPEFDQLSGRFTRDRNMVGMLLCRKLRNKALALQRARDTYQAKQELILVFDDDDVSTLAAMDLTPGNTLPQGTFLLDRINQVIL